MNHHRQPPAGAGFRPVAHTADTGFHLWGPTLADIFIQGGLALTGLMTDRRRLHPHQVLTVTLQAPDQETLLVAWLNHLLYLFDTQGFLPRTIDVLELSPTALTARLAGEAMDPARHTLKTGVKAATYHGLAIRRADDGWTANVIFDL